MVRRGRDDRRNRKAQITLELALSLICALLLLLGALKIFVWVNSRLVMRQDDYEAGRAAAGSSELEDARVRGGESPRRISPVINVDESRYPKLDIFGNTPPYVDAYPQQKNVNVTTKNNPIQVDYISGRPLISCDFTDLFTDVFTDVFDEVGQNTINALLEISDAKGGIRTFEYSVSNSPGLDVVREYWDGKVIKDGRRYDADCATSPCWAKIYIINELNTSNQGPDPKSFRGSAVICDNGPCKSQPVISGPPLNGPPPEPLETSGDGDQGGEREMDSGHQ